MSLAHPSWGRNISPKKLIKRDLIGEGSFGLVYKATWIARDEDENEFRKTVAIKVMKNATREQVFGERDRMANRDHKNVVRLVGVVQQQPPKVPWLVMEYAGNGDLHSNILEWKESGGVTADMMLRILLDIAKGMEYLHDSGIIHGDLAARNVLLTRNNVAKVGDLGYYDGQNANNYFNYIDSGMPCPIRWMPPENLPYRLNSRGNVISSKPKTTVEGDVWAFGVIMFELWSRGKYPFEDYDNDQVCSMLLNGKKPTHFCRVMMRRDARNLMHNCWQYDSDQRPSFECIVGTLEANCDFGSNEDSGDSDNDYEDDDDSEGNDCSEYESSNDSDY